MNSEIKGRTRQFLAKHVPNIGLRDDQNMFAAGFVNSLFALQLVLFVEREFGITVEREDLDVNNFQSIDAIERLVRSKNGG